MLDLAIAQRKEYGKVIRTIILLMIEIVSTEQI